MMHFQVPLRAQRLRQTLGILAICLGLQGCEAIDLINSVGTVLAPASSPSPGQSAAPGLLQQLFTKPSAAPTPSASPIILTQAATAAPLPAAKLNVVKALDPVPLSGDWNLVRQPNVSVTVSSELNPTYEKNRLIDGKLTTSWFASSDDISAKGKLPTIEISFPRAVGVFGVNLRGDRERSEGLQIQEISLLVTSAQGVLINETVSFPAQQTDLNLVLNNPVNEATSVRITITKHVAGKTPGLAEIEVLGRS
ncbi:MAG: discoidin domain-containing protein [Candidatus Sericytochromatia bacterium]